MLFCSSFQKKNGKKHVFVIISKMEKSCLFWCFYFLFHFFLIFSKSVLFGRKLVSPLYFFAKFSLEKVMWSPPLKGMWYEFLQYVIAVGCCWETIFVCLFVSFVLFCFLFFVFFFSWDTETSKESFGFWKFWVIFY